MHRYTRVVGVIAVVSLVACSNGSNGSTTQTIPDTHAVPRSVAQKALRPSATTYRLMEGNSGNSAIHGYDLPSAGGNVAPDQDLTGSATLLNDPGRFAIGNSGYIYVPTTDTSGKLHVYRYAPGATGNTAPDLTLNLPAAYNGVGGAAVDSSSNLWVGVYTTGSFGTATGALLEYAPGASGNASPIRTITGTNTQLLSPVNLAFSSSGDVYASNIGTYGGDVLVFSASATGNASPKAKLYGSNTVCKYFYQLTFDNSAYGSGRYIVVDSVTNNVCIYAAGASGNATPQAVITSVNEPSGVATDTSGDIYVSSESHDAIREFSPGANGNVSPILSIVGSATGLNKPGNLVITSQF